MDYRTRAAQARHSSAMENYDAIAKLAQERKISVRQVLAMPNALLAVFNISRSRPFYYMGRSLTEELLQFILKERREVEPLFLFGDSSLPSDWNSISNVPPKETDVYGFSFITGSPGAGKTYSLLAAVLYLHAQFFKEREAVASGVPEADAGPSSSNKRQRINASKRIVFVEGPALVKSPATSIWNAFFVAFLDHKDALKELEERSSEAVSFMEIDRFLTCWSAPGEVIFVVDDGNKVDRASDAAFLLACLLDRCKVVFCASTSSIWTNVIRHAKTTDYKLVGAALDDNEYRWYKHWFNDCGPVSKTGRVPRLLQQYNFDKDGFVKTIELLEGELDLYFSTLKPSRRRKVFEDLAGGSEVGRLPDLLDTKCFYRGADGRLKCLSSDLQAYALSKVAELIQEDDLAKRYRELDFWSTAVCRDDNIVRIGWNAEMATLLAAKLLELTITYATGEEFTIETRDFNCFSGQIERNKLSRSRPLEPTCHAPRKFNHTGLDFYYEDQKVIVAIHVSVGLNAKHHHQRTVEKAEEIFRGEKRTKVLLWIIYTSGWFSQEVKTAHFSYYSVTMPFAHFSQRLLGIDETLKELRRGRGLNRDVCNKCMKVEGNNAWVQCDSCDLCYHQKCANFSDPEEPFECGDCRDFVQNV